MPIASSCLPVAFLLLAALPACGSGVCTAECPSTDNFSVTNAATGARVCNATIVANGGGSPMTLVPEGSGAICSYYFPGNIPDSFVATVSAPGFQTSSVTARYETGPAPCHCGGYTPSTFALSPE
jgi:hypothetical protein